MNSVAPVVLALELTGSGDGLKVAASGPLGRVAHEIAPGALGELRDALAAKPSRLGELLFAALLPDPVAACYRDHRRRAQESGRVLRLSFRVDPDSGAASWPLEALRDPQGGERLALAADLALTRAHTVGAIARDVGFTPPLKVLIVPSLPGELARQGTGLTAALTEALVPLARMIQTRQARPATERRLEEELRADNWHVLHFIGQGQSRSAVNYGTLCMEGSDGSARLVSVDSIARLLAGHPSLGLVVLQALPGQEAAEAFEVITHKLLERSLPAVLWLPDLGNAASSALFSREVYAQLAVGKPFDRATGHARRRLASRLPAVSAIEDISWSAPVLLTSDAALTPARPPHRRSVRSPDPAAGPSPVPPPEDSAVIKRALEERRRAGQYDVFLCYNNLDHAAVRDIESRLLRRGILPWEYQSAAAPGQQWQLLLDKQIGRVRSAAIFFGPEGLGRVQEQEVLGLLRQFMQRKCPLIPVILPGVASVPNLPLFLEGMVWVDFRLQDPDPLERLIWGISGQRPSTS